MLTVTFYFVGELEMKIQIKTNELINILIQKYDRSLLEKYGLDREKIKAVQDALKEGNWRFIN
jgi:hypothetical protein